MRTELEGLIEFWNSHFLLTKGFVSPSMETLIKQTIKYLEELKKLKRRNLYEVL